MLQFIGRQELTEKKRSGFEVKPWIRSNSYLFIIQRCLANVIGTGFTSLFEDIADITSFYRLAYHVIEALSCFKLQEYGG